MDGRLLEVEGLSCRYSRAEKEALSDVSFGVSLGEFVCICGRSGGGKSTLARCLTGVLPKVFQAQVSGAVRLDGAPLLQLSSWEIGSGLGVVLQNPETQFLTHCAEEEVAFALQLAGMTSEDIPARVGWALRAVGAWNFRACPVRKLSAGQKQRALIAVALARRPRLLLLDEPLALLDPQGVSEILGTLDELLQRYPLAVILFEHRIEQALPYLSRGAILDAGRLAYDGPSSHLARESVARQYGLRNEKLLAAAAPRPEPTPSLALCPALEVEHVSFSYRDAEALVRDCSLKIEPGESLLIHGPNGAGKSTLLRLIMGLLRPTRGHRRLNGSVAAPGVRPERGRSIGYVPQIPHYLFHEKTVEQELACARHRREPDGCSLETDLLLDACDIRHLLRQHPLSLSGGETRRLAIACAMAKNPTLLLLDEPTVGMDGERLAKLFTLLDRYRSVGGAVGITTNDSALLSAPFAQRLQLR